MPIAVVVEAAGFLEDAGELDAAGTHVVDIRFRAGVAILEGSLFLGLAPEDFVIPVRVERRIDVDQIDTGVREIAELFQTIAAVDDAGVENRGGLAGGRSRVTYSRFFARLRLTRKFLPHA